MATSLLNSSSTCHNLTSSKIHHHHQQLQRTYSSSPLSRPICSLEVSQEIDTISTNHNTPADGLQSCFIDKSQDPAEYGEQCNNMNALYLSQSSSSSTYSSDIEKIDQEQLDQLESQVKEDICCHEKGKIFCCSLFEQRIFDWVEENVPKMVNPASKMDSYFHAKRASIRSMSISFSRNTINNILNKTEYNHPRTFSCNEADLLDSINSQQSFPNQNLKVIPEVDISTPISCKNDQQNQIISPFSQTSISPFMESGEKKESSLLARRKNSRQSNNLGSRLQIGGSKLLIMPFSVVTQQEETSIDEKQ